MSGLVIRRYTKADIPQMVCLVKQFLLEERVFGYQNHFYGIEFNSERIINVLLNGLNTPDEFFTNIVINNDGVIVGGLTAIIVPFIFSDERVAKDYLLYFIPEFSNTKALFALINSYVKWAQSNNVREVQLASSTGFKEEKFNKLMEKLNFRQFEVGYARRL